MPILVLLKTVVVRVSLTAKHLIFPYCNFSIFFLEDSMLEVVDGGLHQAIFVLLPIQVYCASQEHGNKLILRDFARVGSFVRKSGCLKQNRHYFFIQNSRTLRQIHSHILESNGIKGTVPSAWIFVPIPLILKHIPFNSMTIGVILKPFGVYPMSSEANLGATESKEILLRGGGDHADICLLAASQRILFFQTIIMISAAIGRNGEILAQGQLAPPRGSDPLKLFYGLLGGLGRECGQIQGTTAQFLQFVFNHVLVH